MALPNDVTILRFYGEGEEVPPVELGYLTRATESLGVVCRAAEAAVGIMQPPDPRFSLVASPRPGCLELAFLVQFADAAALAELAAQLHAAIPHISVDEIAKAFREQGGFFAFMWMVCFGDRGIIDLWKRRSSGEQEPPPPTDAAKQLALDVSDKALATPAVVNGLRETARIFGGGNFSKVTIQVHDSPPVVLSHVDDGRSAALIMRAIKARSKPLPQKDLYKLNRITEAVPGTRRDGTSVVVFLAEVDHQERRVVVWPTRWATPSDQITSEVRLGPDQNLDDILPDVPWPLDFQNAVGVVEVSGLMDS